MPPRFSYDRITPERLSAFFTEQDWSPNTFARIFGCDPKRVGKWLKGEEDAPPWVYPVVCILDEVPGAIPEARKAAADMIRLDRKHPEHGEYPYRQHQEDDDEIDTTAT